MPRSLKFITLSRKLAGRSLRKIIRASGCLELNFSAALILRGVLNLTFLINLWYQLSRIDLTRDATMR